VVAGTKTRGLAKTIRKARKLINEDIVFLIISIFKK
jgi:hypothetical protein